jgi:hypothetical protein
LLKGFKLLTVTFKNEQIKTASLSRSL